MKHLKFEFNKVKRYLMPLFYITVATQTAALYFFAVVGRFDHDETNSIMMSYAGIAGLASVITLCVMAIYGAVLASKFIVRDYIGLNKNKTYLLPVNRKEVFNAKVASLSLDVLISEVLGLVVADLIFVLTEMLFPLVSGSVTSHLGSLGVSAMVCVCFTASIILLASFVGIYRSSSISVVVTSVVLVVLLGNVLTRMMVSFSLLSILCALLIVLLTISAKSMMANLIDHGEAE